MSTPFKRLLRDESGANIIEFALALPILTLFIYGIFTIGMLFQANAGMQHALGEAARFATLCVPDGSGCNVPTTADIEAKITDKKFGLSGGTLSAPSIVTDASNKFMTISLTYTRPTDFLFFEGPTVTLTRSKKVYLAS